MAQNNELWQPKIVTIPRFYLPKKTRIYLQKKPDSSSETWPRFESELHLFQRISAPWRNILEKFMVSQRIVQYDFSNHKGNWSVMSVIIKTLISLCSSYKPSRILADSMICLHQSLAVISSSAFAILRDSFKFELVHGYILLLLILQLRSRWFHLLGLIYIYLKQYISVHFWKINFTRISWNKIGS